jgi:hypothetical protein
MISYKGWVFCDWEGIHLLKTHLDRLDESFVLYLHGLLSIGLKSLIIITNVDHRQISLIHPQVILGFISESFLFCGYDVKYTVEITHIMVPHQIINNVLSVKTFLPQVFNESVKFLKGR